MVEMQRDRKKRPKPFTAADFYCWRSAADAAAAEPPDAGAAMLELIRVNRFPVFALGPWFDDLKAAGTDQPLPPRLAWWSDEIILLAPTRTPDGWSGYLITMAEAAGTVQDCINERGDAVQLIVPQEIGNEAAVEAVVDAVLDIA
jgi:hypothetical protein